MQLPDTLASVAHCSILNTCLGVQCCLDVNLGPLDHSFGTSMMIDPCIGRLALRFGNWQHSKSLSQVDIDTSQEIVIANFVKLR